MRRSLRDVRGLLAPALISGVLLAAALVYLRSAALRGAEQLSGSLSQVIAEQTARTLQSVDGELQLTILHLDMLRREGRLDAGSGRALLRARLPGLPYVRAFWVVDAAGRVVLESGEASIGRPVADTPYFQAFRRDPTLDLFVGGVQRSRVTGRWMIPMARPIRDAAGGVREILVAAVDPPYVEQLWRGVDLGASGAIVLYQRDGQLMVRSPPDEQLMGRDYSGLALFGKFLPAAPSGQFIRVSAVDGRKRVFGYRQLPTYPQLVVVVGLGVREALAPWRHFAALTAGTWALAVIVALMLTLQMRRHARSRRRHEHRFAQLAQAVPQIVFIASPRGALEFVSQRWTEVTGRSPEDALGAGWQQVVHPDDRATMVATLMAKMATGEAVELEHRLLCRDGVYRWQLLRAVPVAEEGRDVPTWFGTATDIDELKQAQQRLARQAEQLRMAGRLTRMGVWHLDLRTGRVTLSEEVAATMDLPPGVEPSTEQVFSMIADPRAREHTQRAVSASSASGEPFDLEVELVTATGRHVWVRSLGEAVRDPLTGDVVAIQGAHQDVTLRVLMMDEIRHLNAGLEERIADRTAQLARQEALFRTLAEQAPLPFWTVDPRGSVTFLSRAWYALVGGAPPDGHGEAWLQWIHPDDVPVVQHNWIRSMVTGNAYAGTRRIRARDGTYHTMNYRAEPVRDAQGEILFWVGIDSDITDLMANEAALRLANKQLESFSYSVSHDLQSPLQRVASYARLLGEELGALAPAKAQHYLARIQANAETMSQLIEALLALAHVSEVEVIRATVNVSDQATEILQRLQTEDPGRRVAWRVEPGLAVIGDARLMRSVLENLIGNAWKFTAQRAQAEIVVGGSRERGEFFVRDNGCGFDMAYADRLFGTFQRLHDADEFPGTGIGLATVARAISRLGGRVWAHAEPGAGATFSFTLPQA